MGETIGVKRCSVLGIKASKTRDAILGNPIYYVLLIRYCIWVYHGDSRSEMPIRVEDMPAIFGHKLKIASSHVTVLARARGVVAEGLHDLRTRCIHPTGRFTLYDTASYLSIYLSIYL